MRCASVIIAYSPNPTQAELASFRQCVKILHKHPLTVACPKSLTTRVYDDIASAASITLTYERFDDVFFKNVAAYNMLMKSAIFYNRFYDYDYILLYQLDAWVFRDELLFWAEKNFDYIGAPWFTDEGKMLPIAGNGGFSLRKVASFSALLSGEKDGKYTWDYSKLCQTCLRCVLRGNFREILGEYRHFYQCRRSPSLYIRKRTENEDGLYEKLFSLVREGKVANSHEALAFAFERFPEKCFVQNNQELPFGCHAYEKYNPLFWRRWIPLA